MDSRVLGYGETRGFAALHRARKCFCRIVQNHGASPLVSVLELSCRNQVQCPPALNLLYDLCCFRLSVHLVKVECLALEESHTEALGIVTLGSRVCVSFFHRVLTYSRRSHTPSSWMNMLKPERYQGGRSARCLWKAEQRKARVPVLLLPPLSWPAILETDNRPKEAHPTRSCRLKDAGHSQDRHLQGVRKQCCTERGKWSEDAASVTFQKAAWALQES